MPEDVNIIDIAKIAEVSVSTVSRVLNNHPDVSAKTRRKVLDVIEEYSYIPNNSARNLKRESMKAIGLVVKGSTNPFFSRMLAVIENELKAQRYLMLMEHVDIAQDEIDAAVSLTKEKKPQGLIFLGGNFRQRRDKLALLDIPFVMSTITIHKGVDRSAFSSVTIDDYAEAYAVTDRICKAGHRKVAAMGYHQADLSVSRLRLDGFRQAMLDNGATSSEIDARIAYAGEFSRSGGYQAAQQLLQKAEFTCLFCISDLMALGAIRAIHDAGHRIPEDISVVGYDGIDAGRYAIPSLATVMQPDEKMAHESVRLLLNRLQRNAAHEHLIFSARFQEGESFRPLAGEN